MEDYEYVKHALSKGAKTPEFCPQRKLTVREKSCQSCPHLRDCFDEIHSRIDPALLELYNAMTDLLKESPFAGVSSELSEKNLTKTSKTYDLFQPTSHGSIIITTLFFAPSGL